MDDCSPEAESTREKREREILEAALMVFSKKGFDGARTKEIAHEAGLSEAAMYKYFPKKESLLSGLLSSFIGTMVKPIVLDSVERIVAECEAIEAFDAQAVITQIFLDRLRLFRAHKRLVKTMVLEAAKRPEIQSALRERILPEIISLFERVYARGLAAGAFRPADPRTVARTAMSLFLGYVLAGEAAPKEFELKQDEAEMGALAEIVIRAFSVSGKGE
jgi:AcrR family transcriptional regulator